jgi:hypothetical protein
MLNHKKLRRLFEAALRDHNTDRFWSDLRESFRTEEIEPADFSIRELFENFIPHGREVIDSWNPRHGDGNGGISMSQLLEADATTVQNFSNISGQIVITAVMNAYDSEAFVFTDLIPTVPTQFNGEKIPGVGQIGDKAQIVPETGAYQLAGVNEDWIETPQTTKRGLLTALTKEALFFDRTGLLLKRCAAVGESLGLNKEKRAINCVIDENTTAHRYNRKSRGQIATYGDNSGNHDFDNLQATNALVDWTDIDNARQLLYSMLDPNTGEPIVLTGTEKLICTRGQSVLAGMIRNATQVLVAAGGFAQSGSLNHFTGSNPVGGLFDVVSTAQLAIQMATDTTWYYGDPSKAFQYMENWPMTTVQAPPNSSEEFHRDIVMQWKSSERGQYVVAEPRAMVKNTV